MRWIQQGRAMDMAGVRILLIKNDVSDTIWHDSLPILKYLGIIYFESLVRIELDTWTALKC